MLQHNCARDYLVYMHSPSGIMHPWELCVYVYAKQKHLGCKKERGQSEATLQTGRRDQKV